MRTYVMPENNRQDSVFTMPTQPCTLLTTAPARALHHFYKKETGKLKNFRFCVEGRSCYMSRLTDHRDVQ